MRIAAIVALSSAVVLAGCEAANMSLTEGGPSRPHIAIAKEVSMVSSEELVGTWRCRELDPYPGQPAVTTDMTLGSDGRMTSTALLPMGDRLPGATDMIMTITADWLVAGDLLQTSNTEVDIKSANGADDAVSRMMAGAAAFFADRAHDGNAEILRMTANELVMRSREDDAPTVSCARQP